MVLDRADRERATQVELIHARATHRRVIITHTYQVRPRVLHFQNPNYRPQFPAAVEVEMHLLPRQPFGVAGDDGRTAATHHENPVVTDVNTGRLWVTGPPALSRVTASLSSGNDQLVLDGNVLSWRQRYDSPLALGQHIEELFFAVPKLLALTLADPPFVEQVRGSIEGETFHWAVAKALTRIAFTDDARHAKAISDALRHLDKLGAPQRPRLRAALHYYQVARRLLFQSYTPGEFLAEGLLNLAKTLECLFPPSGVVKGRDSVRNGLRQLGYSDAQIEAHFIPALLLRNKLDVAHVGLAVFMPEELTVLHEYAIAAESQFGTLLTKVLERIDESPEDFTGDAADPADKGKVALLKQISEGLLRDPAPYGGW